MKLTDYGFRMYIGRVSCYIFYNGKRVLEIGSCGMGFYRLYTIYFGEMELKSASLIGGPTSTAGTDEMKNYLYAIIKHRLPLYPPNVALSLERHVKEWEAEHTLPCVNIQDFP